MTKYHTKHFVLSNSTDKMFYYINFIKRDEFSFSFVKPPGCEEASQSPGSNTQHLSPHGAQTQDGCGEKCHQTQNERVHQRELLHPGDTPQAQRSAQVRASLRRSSRVTLCSCDSKPLPPHPPPPPTAGSLRTGSSGRTSSKTWWILSGPLKWWQRHFPSCCKSCLWICPCLLTQSNALLCKLMTFFFRNMMQFCLHLCVVNE